MQRYWLFQTIQVLLCLYFNLNRSLPQTLNQRGKYRMVCLFLYSPDKFQVDGTNGPESGGTAANPVIPSTTTISKYL